MQRSLNLYWYIRKHLSNTCSTSAVCSLYSTESFNRFINTLTINSILVTASFKTALKEAVANVLFIIIVLYCNILFPVIDQPYLSYTKLRLQDTLEATLGDLDTRQRLLRATQKSCRTMAQKVQVIYRPHLSGTVFNKIFKFQLCIPKRAIRLAETKLLTNQMS